MDELKPLTEGEVTAWLAELDREAAGRDQLARSSAALPPGELLPAFKGVRGTRAEEAVFHRGVALNIRRQADYIRAARRTVSPEREGGEKVWRIIRTTPVAQPWMTDEQISRWSLELGQKMTSYGGGAILMKII